MGDRMTWNQIFENIKKLDIGEQIPRKGDRVFTVATKTGTDVRIVESDGDTYLLEIDESGPSNWQPFDVVDGKAVAPATPLVPEGNGRNASIGAPNREKCNQLMPGAKLKTSCGKVAIFGTMDGDGDIAAWVEGNYWDRSPQNYNMQFSVRDGFAVYEDGAQGAPLGKAIEVAGHSTNVGATLSVREESGMGLHAIIDGELSEPEGHFVFYGRILDNQGRLVSQAKWSRRGYFMPNNCGNSNFDIAQ